MIIDLPAYGDVHFQAPIAFALLPTTDQPNTIRMASDTSILYFWNGSSWMPVNITGSDTFTNIILTNNTNQIVFGTTNLLTLTMAALTGNRNFTLPDANSNPIRPLGSGTAHKWISYIDSTGVQNLTQPAVGDLTALGVSMAAVTDASGFLAVAAATTSAEIGFVNGVTSSIQTQLNGKEASITGGTTAQYWRGDKSFQALNVAALSVFVDGSSGGTTKINEVQTASQASLTTTNVGSTGVYGYAISITPTAGRYLAWGTAQFNQNAANLTAGLQVGISASTSGSGLSNLDTTLLNGLISNSSDAIAMAPMQFFSTTGATTYYLNTMFTYSSGTPKHAGKINFLRIG